MRGQLIILHNREQELKLQKERNNQINKENRQYYIKTKKQLIIRSRSNAKDAYLNQINSANDQKSANNTKRVLPISKIGPHKGILSLGLMQEYKNTSKQKHEERKRKQSAVLHQNWIAKSINEQNNDRLSDQHEEYLKPVTIRPENVLQPMKSSHFKLHASNTIDVFEDFPEKCPNTIYNSNSPLTNSKIITSKNEGLYSIKYIYENKSVGSSKDVLQVGRRALSRHPNKRKTLMLGKGSFLPDRPLDDQTICHQFQQQGLKEFNFF